MNDDRDFEQHLCRLTEQLDVPEVAIADDLARGRRSATRRRRLAVGGAALATAAVVGVGAVVLPSLAGGTEAGPAGDGATPSGPDATPPPVVPGETKIATERSEPQVDGGFPEPPADDRGMLVDLRRAVAGHLDPDGTHISQREIRRPNESGSFDDEVWHSIDQKIGWTNPGESGLGFVVVGVRTSFDLDCGGHGAMGPTATCTETDLAGTPVTRIDDESEGTSYAYRRADGYVTTIALGELYGNNSTVAVSGIDVTEAQLAAVLTDPALDIPGHPDPVTLDVLAGTELRDVARDVLGGANLTDESWAGPVGGYWVATLDGSEVQLEDGLGNYDVDAPCDPTFATRCTHRVVDGMTVRIEHRRNRTGGGYDVTVAGPARDIWVHVSPALVPVDLAVDLATDPRLQR